MVESMFLPRPRSTHSPLGYTFLTLDTTAEASLTDSAARVLLVAHEASNARPVHNPSSTNLITNSIQQVRLPLRTFEARPTR